MTKRIIITIVVAFGVFTALFGWPPWHTLRIVFKINPSVGECVQKKSHDPIFLITAKGKKQDWGLIVKAGARSSQRIGRRRELLHLTYSMYSIVPCAKGTK